MMARGKNPQIWYEVRPPAGRADGAPPPNSLTDWPRTRPRSPNPFARFNTVTFSDSVWIRDFSQLHLQGHQKTA